jgi:serine/threonine protein kinase
LLFGAVLFLNGRGIAHRDIKPENLLLMAREYDARGVRLAVSDSGGVIAILLWIVLREEESRRCPC